MAIRASAPPSDPLRFSMEFYHMTEGSKSNIRFVAHSSRGRCTAQHLRRIRGCDAHPAHMSRNVQSPNERAILHLLRSRMQEYTACIVVTVSIR
jgi:hypothetical protein